MPSNPPKTELANPWFAPKPASNVTGEITVIHASKRQRCLLSGRRGSFAVIWQAPKKLGDALKTLQPGSEVRVLEDGTLLANGSVEVYPGIIAGIPTDGFSELSSVEPELAYRIPVESVRIPT